MERENFKSRLGFLLVSAGCAIGIGNVWKFPFVTGQNGGGVFVLFYLIFLVIMGVPVLTMELAVGRASRQSAVKGYKALEPEGSKWHIHGWFCIIGCYLLMMYYTTVSGWMFDYFVKFLTGTFDGMASESVGDVFGNMLGNTKEMALFMCIMVVAGVFVCSIGIQDGLEKISKFMMLALMVLILVLAVHSLSLSGAADGIRDEIPVHRLLREDAGVLEVHGLDQKGQIPVSQSPVLRQAVGAPMAAARVGAGVASVVMLPAGVVFWGIPNDLGVWSNQDIVPPALQLFALGGVQQFILRPLI